MIQVLSGLCCLIAAAVWGFAFVVVKDSLAYISPLYMVAFRFSIAAVVMMIVFFQRLKRINKAYLLKAGLVGVFLFLGYLTQTVGCNFTTPGKNAFFTTVYVVIIPFLCWAVMKKRPKWFVFAAVFIQIAGIGFLSLGEDIRDGIRLNDGDVLTLACGVFFALQMFWQGAFSKTGEETDPFLYALIEFAVAALLGWLCAPFYDMKNSAFTLQIQPFPVELMQNTRCIVSVLYLGLGSTALAFAMQNIGLKYLNPSLATILLSFESVFGMLFSILIPINGIRETLSPWGAVGCVLIFIAVLLAQKTS